MPETGHFADPPLGVWHRWTLTDPPLVSRQVALRALRCRDAVRHALHCFVHTPKFSARSLKHRTLQSSIIADDAVLVNVIVVILCPLSTVVAVVIHIWVYSLLAEHQYYVIFNVLIP